MESAKNQEDIRSNISRIRVNPLNRLSLLRHHPRKLRENLPQLGDGRFDRLDSCTAGLNLVVLLHMSAFNSFSGWEIAAHRGEEDEDEGKGERSGCR